MAATDLIISEYIEGSSNNKAIELYNGTSAPIDLTAGKYQIKMFFNGGTTAGLTINLVGVVQPGDVFVLAHGQANAAILAQADQTNSAGWFNGDDAVVLYRDGVAIDSFGDVGFDPGTEWGTGLESTADNTLVRKNSVTTGDTNLSDDFVPANEWVGSATDTISTLGLHNAVPSYSIAALSANQVEGDVGVTAFTFTVTRPSGVGTEVVPYTVTGTGTEPAAANAADFAGGTYPSGNVTFADGVTSMTLTIDIAGETLNEADEAFTVTLGVANSPSAQGTIRNDDVLLTEIHDIQGAAHRSPLEGQMVATIGIVTAITSNGFWIQDPTPDSDARTSEGIFVFTSTRPASNIVVGDEVRVSGRVTEFFPDSGSTAELSLTEIATSSGGFVQRTGNTGAIAATLVGSGGLLPPTEAYGDDTDQFDPMTQGLDFWESLEGMRVTLNDAVATAPSDTSSFGDSETFVRLDGTNAGLLTPSGGLLAQEGDTNPERIAVQEDNRVFDNDYRTNVGDLLGDVTGIVNYDSSGNYEVIATQGFTVTSGGLQREGSTNLVADANHLTIASYNAENLAFTNPATKFVQIAEQIVNVLKSPDIVALQEVQDDNGATGGGVVSAEQTLARLVETINAVAGPNGPHYAWAYVTPDYNEDGGQQSGNIRQAFLYNTDRVKLADGAVGGANDAVAASSVNGEIDLNLAVGRIDPTNGAFDNSRKPLVAEFVFNGESVFVINNHFNSKIGDDPLFGANQPPVEETLAKRIEQAKIVADFVDDLLSIDPDANVAVVGDLNDFGYSQTLQRVEAAGLSNLADLLPLNERYDYVFQGNSQELDHILVSDNLGESAAFDIVHINSEFWNQTSDHDPLVARLNIEAGEKVSGGNGDDSILGGAGDDWINGGNGADIISGGNGKDELLGGLGDDRLFGGNAADKLFGEFGADRLDGGAGDDLLSGAQGDDWLTGGAGADTFIFVKSGGEDRVTDFNVAEDLLQLADGVSVKTHKLLDANGDGISDLYIGFNGGGVTLLGVSSYADVQFG